MYPPATSRSRAAPGRSALNDLDLGQREDHLTATGEEFPLPRHDAVLEVPGEDQEVIGLHRLRFSLGNDRNVRTGREASELVRIQLGDGGNVALAEAAKLQENVP